jgi:hypothetical protein
MSVFRESLVFFDHVGLFDVVLPFLLVFTLVFGVLEKSRIFGTEKTPDDKKTVTRKNLNAMVAFCVSFFVVASAQLVALINIFVARIALVLVILVMFMLLIGSLQKQQGNDGFDFLSEWKWLAYVVIAAVVLIFTDGVGWLQPAWAYATGHWDSQLMGTVFLFAIVIGFIMYVTNAPKGEDKPKSS